MHQNLSGIPNTSEIEYYMEFSICYLLYKEMSFLATLASMSFFKRSDSYKVYFYGRIGHKNDVKAAKQNMGTHVLLFFFCIFFCFIVVVVFMQASDSVINKLNKNKFLLPYLQSVIIFFHINK